MRGGASFLRDARGAGAAEFALVLPVTLLFFFGIIDGGRYVWVMNQLEKAVHLGTRMAVVTDVVASDLNTTNYVGLECPAVDADGEPTTKPIKVGDPICADVVPTITCTWEAGAMDCGDGEIDDTAFTEILDQMQIVAPYLTNANSSWIRDQRIFVTYSGSGLGYAGDPAVKADGTALGDAAPLVTVSVQGARLRTLFLLGGSIPLPDFSYSQTLEDGEGHKSY